MRYVIACVFLAALLAAALPASAKTQVFLETNEDQFAQGHSEGVVWTSQGTLRLGRAVESLLGQTEGVDYVARLAEAPDGSVYAVTGGLGRIYRIKDGKVDLFATVPDKFLFSCAVDPKGVLYVGSGGQKGRIWRVTPADKGVPAAEVFFEQDGVKYVWDLAWMKDGSLAAATGDQGKLLRIAPDGKSEVLIDSEAHHVLCVLAAPDGTLYAGTDGEALVYRWADKKAFILYDAEQAEITCLALDAAGNLYAGASSGAAGRTGGADASGEGGAKPATPVTTISITPSAAGGKETPAAAGQAAPAAGGAESAVPAASAAAVAAKVSETAQAARPAAGKKPMPGAGSGGSAVYRITPQGIASRFFDPKDAMVLALAFSDGQLLVGTGKNARVYEVGCMADEQEACVAAIDPKQVMALMTMRDGRVVAGSAGPGRLYAISRGSAREGTYTSQVYDAGGSARWGTVEWRSRTPDATEIRMASRTGNVKDPEKGLWSEWTKGEAKSPARIESPAGRFIQFRVLMKTRADGPTPVLDQFEAAYVRVNEPPRVASIGEAMTPEQQSREQAMERFRQALKTRARPVPGQALPPMPPLPPPEGAQPVRMLQWQVLDPNGDTLRYDLYFRGQGEPNWIVLEKDLVRPEYAWDTTSVADGWYEIKVVAGDRADNPADTALEDAKISDPILIDNTPPVIEKVEIQAKAAGEVEVRFTARDATSRLTAAAWTVDSAADWRTLAPTDGLFDGRTKEFRFTIRGLGKGPHRLALRASDEVHNVGRAARTLEVEK